MRVSLQRLKATATRHVNRPVPPFYSRVFIKRLYGTYTPSWRDEFDSGLNCQRDPSNEGLALIQGWTVKRDPSNEGLAACYMRKKEGFQLNPDWRESDGGIHLWSILDYFENNICHLIHSLCYVFVYQWCPSVQISAKNCTGFQRFSSLPLKIIPFHFLYFLISESGTRIKS